MHEQHAQTLAYFNAAAEEWRRKAEGKVAAAVNVVRQRNAGVLRLVRERPEGSGGRHPCGERTGVCG